MASNLHDLDLAGDRAEAMRRRRAYVARAKTRAQLSRAARRAHGAQEPSGAKLRYAIALTKFAAQMWALAIEQARPAIETATRKDDFASTDRQLFNSIRIRLYREVHDKAPAIIKQAGDDVSKHNAGEMKRLVGFNPRIDPGLNLALDKFRADNVALITKLADDQIDRIETTLSENYGLRAEDLAKKLDEQGDVTGSRAKLIARDQTLKLNGQLTQTRQQSAGIEEYIWTTSGDERVRDEHAERDGERFRWDTPPEDGNPGQPIQCRCTAFPIVPGLDEDA